MLDIESLRVSILSEAQNRHSREEVMKMLYPNCDDVTEGSDLFGNTYWQVTEPVSKDLLKSRLRNFFAFESLEHGFDYEQEQLDAAIEERLSRSESDLKNEMHELLATHFRLAWRHAILEFVFPIYESLGIVYQHEDTDLALSAAKLRDGQRWWQSLDKERRAEVYRKASEFQDFCLTRLARVRPQREQAANDFFATQEDRQDCLRWLSLWEAKPVRTYRETFKRGKISREVLKQDGAPTKGIEA